MSQRMRRPANPWTLTACEQLSSRRVAHAIPSPVDEQRRSVSSGGVGVVKFTTPFGEPKFNELTSDQTPLEVGDLSYLYSRDRSAFRHCFLLLPKALVLCLNWLSSGRIVSLTRSPDP